MWVLKEHTSRAYEKFRRDTTLNERKSHFEFEIKENSQIRKSKILDFPK